MNSKIIKWGVLSTAKIGIEKVIPAMQKCDNLEIHAISSRNEQNARLASEKLGIQKSYGDYESMLKDPEIDAIYNPLPNHLHYAWTKMAIEHGEHVLCEKPMTLDKDQVAELIALRDQMGVKAGEAFMVHTHPQWLDAVQRIKNGELGQLNSVQGFLATIKRTLQISATSWNTEVEPCGILAAIRCILQDMPLARNQQGWFR
jgi:predicted dehydrogenase